MEETVSVEVALPPGGSVTLAGFSEASGPAGDTLVAKLTVPAKLLTLVTVIVDELLKPCPTLNADGLELILKPCTTKPPRIEMG